MSPADQTTVDWALAVDYGTNDTCAAVSTGERVEILEVGFDRCLPSPVGVDDDGRFVTGRDAVELGRWDAERVERAPKRALAAGSALRLGGRTVDPIDLVAATLRRIADEALRRFGGTPPSRVVLTHPVHWRHAATGRLLAAATRAGLTGLELLPEPSAVAAFHGATVPVGGQVAVFGLGSDSFGAAVLRRTATTFELRGDAHRDIGGEAVDAAVLELVAGHARGADPDAWDRIWTGPGSRREQMRERLLAAKAELSSRPWVAVAVDGIDSGVRITRRELERAVEARLSTALAELLGHAEIDPAELDAVYLSGGPGHMPRIAELIRERTGLAPDVHDDPKAVVALGALERLPARAAPELVLAGASTAAAVGSAPADHPDTGAPTVALPLQRDSEFLTVPATDPGPAEQDAVVEIPPAEPATGRSSHRLRPVLVGVGMAALVAGVVTPIALHSGSASAPPATIAAPVVVVATTPQPAPTTAARPSVAPSTAASVRTVTPSSAAAPTSARSAAQRIEPALDARHLALLRALADVGGVRWSTCAAYVAGETADFVTAIQCSTGDPSLARNIVFYRLAGADAYATMKRTSAAEVNGTGSCAAGAESATTWGPGTPPKGFLVCYDDPDTSDFRISWASSESLLAAVISDPEAATAYTWWKSHNATIPSAAG